MKMLLILWALSLVKCDKLDRTYLPPAGSVIAGRQPEDLILPFEFSKEKYPSTVEPGYDRIKADGSFRSKYSKIAIGIDRKAPHLAKSPEFFSNPSKNSFPINVYNVPTTSYDLINTSIISPLKDFEVTKEPMTTVFPANSSIVSSFDPNLSYDQYLIQQITKQNNPKQTIPIFTYSDPELNSTNNHVSQIQTIFSGSPPHNAGLQSGSFQPNSSLSSKIHDNVPEQLDKIGTRESKLSNIHSVSNNLNPHHFYITKHPTNQYQKKLGMEPVTICTGNTSPDKHHDQYNFKSHSTQKVPSLSEGINVNSSDFSGTTETGISSTLVPIITFVESSEKNVTIQSPKYSSSPTYTSFNENLNTRYTNVQPQSIQAEDVRNAGIFNYNNILTPESFAYSFDTSNGIHVDQSGTAINGVRAQGSFSFTGDDGKVYSVEYTADENGFLPRGDHLPTAPPIPDAILRGIELAKKNQQLGLIDDGSYDNAKYGHSRYEGFIDRLSQKHSKINKPNIREKEQISNLAAFNELDLSMQNGKVLNKISNYDIGVKFNITNISKIEEIFEQYSNNGKKNVFTPNFNNTHYPNGNIVLSSQVKNMNNFKENLANSNHKIDEKLALNTKQNSGNIPTISMNKDVFNPMHYNVDLKQDNISVIKQHLNMGYYEYPQPQNLFDGNDKNGLQSRLLKIREKDKPINDDETSITSKVSYDFIKIIPDLRVLRKRLNSSFTTSSNTLFFGEERDNSGINTLNTPIFYNKESDDVIDDENLADERVSSTLDPKHASTKSPYTSDKTGEQHYNYASSTLQHHSSSTTPLSSEIFSPFTPTTSTSKVTSTSRVPDQGYTGNISALEPAVSRMWLIKPNNFGQRINRRPGYQSRPNNFAQYLKPELRQSKDPRIQNLRASSRPENLGHQSTTDKYIGEIFSGSDQPQRFDPGHGYYY